MKKVYFFSFWLLLTMGMATVVFNSCVVDDPTQDDPKPDNPTTIAVNGIRLDKATLMLAIDEEYTFTTIVTPEEAADKTVTWASTDTSIVKVVEGKATAIAEGIAIITAQAGNKVAICEVTVSFDAVAITGISLDTVGLVLAIVEDYTLTAIIAPNNATDKTVTWTSSDSSIVKVTNGNVMALTEGTVTITAKARNYTTTCTVTVTNPISTVINGVEWATRNVDNRGTFVAKPENAGKLYRWNREKAWPATGDATDWESTIILGDTVIIPGDSIMPADTIFVMDSTWVRANDPSPTNWRVPTLEEIQRLLDTDKVTNEWVVLNGIGGRKFKDKESGRAIFLPAVGYRNYRDGKLNSPDTYGYYWSSTVHDVYETKSYNMFFFGGGASWDYNSRGGAYSIRCVVE